MELVPSNELIAVETATGKAHATFRCFPVTPQPPSYAGWPAWFESAARNLSLTKAANG